MRIAFGADHAGFDLKERLVEHVRSRGHEAIDVGTHGPASVDYPSYGITNAIVVGRCSTARPIAPSSCAAPASASA